MGTITTTGYYPDANGFWPGGSWIGKIAGGTTINAVVESTVNGVWMTEPGEGVAIIGTWSQEIPADSAERFRYNVLSVSGVWQESHHRVQP